jgi:aminobutyraldehyde dehydrogenase
METRLLINGRFTPGDGEAQPVIDPATGALLTTVSEASAAQVTAAVDAAAAAFDSWSATVPKDRAAPLLKLADHIEANASD